MGSRKWRAPQKRALGKAVGAATVHAPVPPPHMLSSALRAATRCTAVALEGSAMYWQAWSPGGVLEPQKRLW